PDLEPHPFPYTTLFRSMARPATVCVPSVGPAHPSVRTTSKLALTSTSPTFWTVTTTCAVSPWITERGPVMPGSAISVGLGFTVRSEEHTSELQSRFDLV